jgi:hypothetical protein
VVNLADVALVGARRVQALADQLVQVQETTCAKGRKDDTLRA